MLLPFGLCDRSLRGVDCPVLYLLLVGIATAEFVAGAFGARGFDCLLLGISAVGLAALSFVTGAFGA